MTCWKAASASAGRPSSPSTTPFLRSAAATCSRRAGAGASPERLMTCCKAASASAGRPSSPARPPGMSSATDTHRARQSARGGTRDDFPDAVADQKDRGGDGEHEQRQHTELEQETVQLLVRLWLLKLRGHDQHPPDSGDQPDVQEWLGSDLVVQEVGTQRVGEFGDDEGEQSAFQY